MSRSSDNYTRTHRPHRLLPATQMHRTATYRCVHSHLMNAASVHFLFHVHNTSKLCDTVKQGLRGMTGPRAVAATVTVLHADFTKQGTEQTSAFLAVCPPPSLMQSPGPVPEPGPSVPCHVGTFCVSATADICCILASLSLPAQPARRCCQKSVQRTAAHVSVGSCCCRHALTLSALIGLLRSILHSAQTISRCSPST